MGSDTAQTPDSSILVVIDSARSAKAILGWSLHQADRRHSRIDVLYVPAFGLADEVGIVDQATVAQDRKQLALTLDRLGAGPQTSS